MGVKLKNAMQAAGIDRKALATATGITQDAVRNYINGTRCPRADILKRIAQKLGVTMESLI